MTDVKEEEIAGCFLALWSLFITCPIWLILLFLILNALGDAIPIWAWILYWIYVPATILGVITTAFARIILK